MAESLFEMLGDRSLVREVSQLKEELLQHPIYHQLETIEDLRIYMSHHVFAVWDFMSLVKSLQQTLTTVTVPWMPRLNPSFTRFINEIVLDEESDQDGQGGYMSHFELYREAMRECSADSQPIERFLARLNSSVPVADALAQLNIPSSIAQFVTHTLTVAIQGKPHEVAATFLYGREAVIPDMFQQIVNGVVDGPGSQRFIYYVRRHIELDGEQHGPLAAKLLTALCQEDFDRWNEALMAASAGLRARIQLWDGVLAVINQNRSA